MTHHNISYKGRANPQRDAALDLVQWYGFRKSLLLARYCREMRKQPFDYASTKGWKGFSIPVSMSGVQGFPVWNTYERWTGITLPYENSDNG
jgi:hypothetical protein